MKSLDEARERTDVPYSWKAGTVLDDEEWARGEELSTLAEAVNILIDHVAELEKQLAEAAWSWHMGPDR